MRHKGRITMDRDREDRGHREDRGRVEEDPVLGRDLGAVGDHGVREPVDRREARGREHPEVKPMADPSRHVGLEKGIDRQEERDMVNREDVPGAVPTGEVLVDLVGNVLPNGDLEDPKGREDPHQWHFDCKILTRW
jgi:hypothetical protein